MIPLRSANPNLTPKEFPFKNVHGFSKNHVCVYTHPYTYIKEIEITELSNFCLKFHCFSVFLVFFCGVTNFMDIDNP